MKKYLTVCKLEAQVNIEYRWNLVFDVFAQVMTSLFIVLIWKHISKGQAVGAFSENELLTYLLLAGFVLASIHSISSGDYVNNLIKDGKLSFLLVQPWNIPLIFFFQSLVRRITLIIAAFIGYGALIWGFGVKITGISWQGLILAVPVIVIAIILHFLIFHSLSFLAFWLDQTWGPRLLFRVLIDLGAGILIPLSLLQTFWGKVFSVLPFRFFGDAVVLTAMRQIQGVDYLKLLLLGTVWVVVWLLICTVIWKKGTRSFEAVGQ